MQENFNDYNENPAQQNTQDVDIPFTEENYSFFLPDGFEPMEYLEKESIQKAANRVGFSLIFLLLANFIVGLIYSLFLVEINPAMGTVSFSEDPAISMAVQILTSIAVFTLPFSLVYKLCGYRISSLVSFKKTEKGLGLPMFFFGVAFCAFANMASSYTDAIFEAFGIDYSIPDLDLPEGVFGFLLTFLAISVVPAFVEEFACRGIILGSLRKFGDGFAVMTSAILFGLLHGNFEQIPFAFLVGLFLGFSVVKTNSLRVAIAVHFFNNFISVFFSYFLNDVTVEIQNVIYSVFLLLCLTFGMLFLKIGKEGAKLFTLEKVETKCTEKQKYKWFFTSATIIIFIVLCLLEALMFILN